MKAVFLDYATMGPDLDLTALQGQFAELKLFDDTSDDIRPPAMRCDCLLLRSGDG